MLAQRVSWAQPEGSAATVNCQHPVEVIEHHSDVQVLVGVDTHH